MHNRIHPRGPHRVNAWTPRKKLMVAVGTVIGLYVLYAMTTPPAPARRVGADVPRVGSSSLRATDASPPSAPARVAYPEPAAAPSPAPASRSNPTPEPTPQPQYDDPRGDAAEPSEPEAEPEEPTDFGPATDLNPPHGGELVDLVATKERAQQLIKEVSPSLPSLTLTQRQLCDIEMLMNGGFSPLKGFMDETTYKRVVHELRLPSGEVWPMPITLDVSKATAATYKKGQQVALRDEFFNLIAILTISDIYTPNKKVEAEQVFRTTDRSHPAVAYLFEQAGPVYIGGSIEGVTLPPHFDFNEIRFTPAQAREEFKRLGWGRFVAFQTRNPMHRAHIELTRRAAREIQGRVFINPVVGMTKPGDVDYATRVRCYLAVLKNSARYYGEGGVFLGLLPLAMRMAGPREALWHSIIRKNFGATHFIVGRDHAGCKSSAGEDFYGAYDAQQLVAKYADEIGIKIQPFKMLVYLPSTDKYVPYDEVPEGADVMKISGTKFRAMMARGDEIPQWYSDPGIIAILREVNPPKPKRGFTVFFTGLSGSGKTTISHALVQRLTSMNPARRITVLDGDVVRTHLSKGLKFSVSDRNTNVARIGWVAAEVTRQRGIAVACSISPFESSRAAARAMTSPDFFMLVHVSTSLEECMARDVKGLYKQAVDGRIKLTGYSHPYELPDHAELTLDGATVPVANSVDFIIGYLTKHGYLHDDQAARFLDEFPQVITDEVLDPAARQCQNLDRPSITFGYGPSESSLTVLRHLLKAGGATTYTLSAKTLAGAEAGGREGPAKDVPTDLAVKGEDFDPLFETGTLASTPLDDSERLEAAWWLYEYFKSLKATNLVITSPRLILYLPNLLRFDPCVKVVAVTMSEDAMIAVMTRAGVEPGKAARYVHEYQDTVHRMAESHPQRVMTVASDEIANEQATVVAVKHFAGLTEL